MKYAIRAVGAIAGISVLASCSSVGGGSEQGSLQQASPMPAMVGVSDDVVKIGAPFTVGGTTYTPQDTAQYDEVGYASYYGAELAGRPTANGEMFNPAGASAAHKTLPLPSYVEVTALDTGRTILVRVNDRGPFANDRLIDLSEAAARQLGIAPQGVAGVRVRRVNPPEQEKSILRQGMTAAERIETPGPLLKVLRDKLAKLAKPSAIEQKPALAANKTAPRAGSSPGNERFVREDGNVAKAKTSPSKSAPGANSTAASGNIVAQIAAFSSRTRADALAKRVGASVASSSDGRLFRVRFGPFASESEAAAAARNKGYPQASIYRD